MGKMLDLELHKTPEPPLEDARPKRPVALWIVVAGLVVAMAVAAYIAFGGRPGAAPPAAPARQAESSPPPDQPLGGSAPAVVVPPLDESDPVVRELVRQLSSHPRIAAWLATNGLIRNFTVSVANVAEGVSPARHLGVLRPTSGFRVVERGGSLYIDPRSYERYDSLAAAAASIDPAGAARLYSTLKPRIEDANRELGAGAASFDRTLERAIVSLLQAPVLQEGNVRVLSEVQGIGYGFADSKLEDLTPAQKQLLRMGPRNAAIIQSSLRAIAVALGIPAERLPRPQTAAASR
jgi:hypothetical protein